MSLSLSSPPPKQETISLKTVCERSIMTAFFTHKSKNTSKREPLKDKYLEVLSEKDN